MDAATVNKVTLWIFLLPVLVWLPWEMFLLWRRRNDTSVQTLSMVARGLGYRVTVLPYLWGGLGTHYWLNRDGWGSTWAGVIFWVIALVLIIDMVAQWDTPIEEWPKRRKLVLWPGTMLLIGGAAGYFLFPQAHP